MSAVEFTPTHVVPADGLPYWSDPDAARAPDGRAEPGLEVMQLETTFGWARVRFSNGWETWVDGRQLVARSQPQPEPEPEPEPAPPSVQPFAPTHVVPSGGLDARANPDAGTPADHRLEAGVELIVLDEDLGWAFVRGSNGFEAWVDGRQLRPLLAPPDEIVPPPVTAPAPVLASAPVPPARGRIPMRAVVPAFGAALVIIGSVLPWFSFGGGSVSAWDVPLSFLVSNSESSGVDAGPVLLIVAIALIPLLTSRPLPWGIGIVISGVATNIGILGVRRMLDFPGASPSMGIGLVLVLVGGAAMVLGTLVGRHAPATAAAAAIAG